MNCTHLDSPRAKAGQAVSLNGKSDALGFFEAIALADMESKWLRLPASVQRYFFGAPIFGRKAVKVEPDGRVLVFWTTGFGQDWERAELRYSQTRKVFTYEGHENSTWNKNNC